jgi:tRNA (guanine-N7-)-methyltransferase
VHAITLNFPTPFPRKKDAAKRLTIIERLMDYRTILAEGSTVLLKTDSYPLWRFTQTQFDLAHYQVLWCSDDAHAERPDDTLTEYEQRLCAQGATVYAIEATPLAWTGPLKIEQTASVSLIDYLPDDLESLSYVPHGMQGSVINLRNRKKHERNRQKRR